MNSPNESGAARGRERALLAAVLLAVGIFDVWTVRSSGDPWNFGRKQKDYYNLLIDGFLDGHLYLKVEVPAALRQLPDPYDPRQRPPGLALHDASFYHGKYYLYFGVAPVVVLLLPFRLLTGIDLPQAVAVLIFVYGGFLASAAVWLQIRRRYFPSAGAILAALGVLGLGGAGLGPVLLRRPHVWELPIGAGYCFAMLTLLAVYGSLHSPRRARWMAAAGFFLGLAVGSRPVYFFATPLLVLPWWAWWREAGRIPWRPALAAVGPLAAIGALLAWHNYARFGDPRQFGQAYQLSLDYEANQAHFGWRYAFFNLRAYFFSRAEWTQYFPFIRPAADAGAPPAGYAVRGEVYGLFVNLPLACFALVAPLALWRREAAARARLGAWLAAAGGLAVVTTGFLLCFFSALPRYMLDFTPAVMLLGAVGVLAADRWGGESRAAWRRGGMRVLGAGALLSSVLFAVLFSLRVDGLLLERNPIEYGVVARWFNHLPAWLEHWRGGRRGPLQLTLRLAPAPPGREQRLATVGDDAPGDRIFVRFGEAGRVRFGVESAHGVTALTPAVPVDFVSPHALRVSLGSLLPPAAYPMWHDASAAQVAALARRLRIDFDGATLLDTSPWFAGPPGAVRLEPGVAAVRDEAAMVALLHESGSSGGTDFGLAGTGAIKLSLVLPSDRVGASEPLLVLGHPGAADFICIQYVDAHTIRFAFDHWGSALQRSGPVTIDFGRAHELVIAVDSLAVGAEPDPVRHIWRGALVVAVDGREVWNLPAEFFNVPRAEIVVGRNVAGGTACAPDFTGRIVAAGRAVAGR